MAGVDVQHHRTPNPNAVKFVVPGRRLVESGSRSFFDAAAAAGDPLASAVMGLDGVASIFMVNDFVTVTRTPEADWGELIPRVEAAIRNAL
jgi:hypothetical protein